MQQSRGPVRFCCLETSKNATVSWSGSFLLSRSLKKCNSLVVRLVFAVWKPQKLQQTRAPARFRCLECPKGMQQSADMTGAEKRKGEYSALSPVSRLKAARKEHASPGYNSATKY